MQHEESKSIKHQGKSIRHKIQHTVAQWYGGEGVERGGGTEKGKNIGQKFKKEGGKLGFVL